MQRSTRTGKPIINGDTKLPLYTLPVALRIKNITKELFGGMSNNDARWQSIINSTQLIKQ